jgi:hypothetical protein
VPIAPAVAVALGLADARRVDRSVGIARVVLTDMNASPSVGCGASGD